MNGPHVNVDPNALCPHFAKYKFCHFGWDCPQQHTPVPERDVNDLFNELVQVGQKHMSGDFQCMLCGQRQDPNNAISAKVGETEAYPFCGQCGNYYYYPHVQDIILKLLQRAGQDYMEYKRLVDAHYRRLPAILQPPFMYEAHRWGTSRYAWSLTGPVNAREILDIVRKYKPQVSRIVSMGSGTGYIEHVFYSTAKQLGVTLDIQAFDTMPPKEIAVKFDVAVQVGDVSSLGPLGDMAQSVLLLCWPPFGSKVNEESQMGFDTLQKYTEQGGDLLVYIGDVNATGDWRYHNHLASHWELLPETLSLTKLSVWVPQLMGLLYAGNDSIGIYRKRDVPLQIEPPEWTVTA